MKKFTFILAFVYVMIMTGASAQLSIPKRAYWHLSGTIGKAISASMNLVKINDSLYASCTLTGLGNEGTFSSFESGKPCDLAGRMDATGNLQLKPFGSEFPCLKGQLLNAVSFKGECEEGKDKKSLHFEFNEIYKAGSVQFNVYSLNQTTPLVKKQKSPAGKVSMAVLSPMESGNSFVSDSLRKIMLKAFDNSGYQGNNPDSVLSRNARLFKRDYLNGNLELYKQMPDAGALNWQLLRFMHIITNGNYILCFSILNYAFTGGAHGLETLEYLNINLRTGSILKLGDILAEGRKGELGLLLTRKLKHMNQMPGSGKLTENGYFVDEIQPNENFYLTPEGIGFLYNHYDIAPYSFGSTDIFLTADEVKDIIRPFTNGF